MTTQRRLSALTAARVRWALAFAAIPVLILSTTRLTASSTASADAPGTSFSVDLDPSANGVQSTRDVPLGALFSVDVVLDSMGSPPDSWVAFGVTLTYDDVQIDMPASGLPAGSWFVSPRFGVHGGITAPPFAGGTSCFPAPTNSISDEDDMLTATVAAGCQANAADDLAHVGPLIQFVFTCESAGPASLTLSDVKGTFILDPFFISANGHQHNATVNCGVTPADTESDGMRDVYEATHGCLVPGVADGFADPDGDSLINGAEHAAGTNPCISDTDMDGCADGEEKPTNPPASGGQRNPLNRWDFYDVTGSRKVDSADIGLVRSKFNQVFVAYDRSGGASPWAPDLPNGVVNATDVGLVRASFNHDCQGPPN